jgi:hypothetical protein
MHSISFLCLAFTYIYLHMGVGVLVVVVVMVVVVVLVVVLIVVVVVVVVVVVDVAEAGVELHTCCFSPGSYHPRKYIVSHLIDKFNQAVSLVFAIDGLRSSSTCPFCGWSGIAASLYRGASPVLLTKIDPIDAVVSFSDFPLASLHTFSLRLHFVSQ